jgi:2-polyprenyl-6-methoxyphenol hydroxylase-like FAD-dependent oxidoreductase
VLVVGGGPVGLATALELCLRGVDCTVIEPRETVSDARPRAKTTSIRTMEHLRRLGVAEALRDAAPIKVEYSQDAVFCTALAGREITRFSGVFGLTTRPSEIFAETSQQVPQPVVERVLRRFLAEHPHGRLWLGWRLYDLVQRAGAVTAEVRHERTGARATIEAEYAVGCDGAGSRVRQAIGAVYRGQRSPRPNFNLVVHAPGLRAAMQRLGPAVHYWVLNPEQPGLVGPMDGNGRWWMIAMGVDAETGASEAWRLVERLAGTPVEGEVLSTDPWSARMLLADRLYADRVLLAGDAAHLNPPWGGHGFNTGIGDAVDLGWKLAAVLDGWGADGLVESYESERRGVHERVIASSTENMAVLSTELSSAAANAPGAAGEEARAELAERIQAAKRTEFHSLGLVLGYRYDDSPEVVPDGTPVPPVDVTHYEPTARPGARLPHAWLAPGRALYDELGPGFTLLRLGEADPGPLLAAAGDRRVPVKLVDLRERALDYGAPLVLVRPDQHVAWRGDRPPTDPLAVVDRVRGAGC